jgi:C-terminal processing protease CtpA/Prc
MLLMGDTTSGGLGLPTMGCLPNGWFYRFPVTRTFALDGNNYENGVPPDILLKFNPQTAATLGRDNIIDSACAIIQLRTEK